MIVGKTLIPSEGRWVCSFCGEEAHYHLARKKKHYFMCQIHWSIYNGFKEGVIEWKKSKSACSRQP